MRPADLIARMLSDDDAVILLDRRGDFARLADVLGFEIVASVGATSPVGGELVQIALLREAVISASSALSPMRTGDRSGRAEVVRLLDRFFIPAAGDPVVSVLLFELIAEHYERLTTGDVNRRAAEILLRSALRKPSEGPVFRVLDFGCGTGFALDASKRLEQEGWNIHLAGTDASDAMLSIARGRGQRVLTLAEWRDEPPECFNAAISCFVLHYGVPEQDLVLIARQLKPGGLFSANLFKGDEASVARLATILNAAGLDLISNQHLAVSTESSNRHLVFAKRGKAS